MRHTFQVAFHSHTGLKRKYCFSVPDQDALVRWTRLLNHQIATTGLTKEDVKTPIRRAAEGVALQVLRDAVIPPENVKGKNVRSGSVSLAYIAGGEPGPTQASRGSGIDLGKTSGMLEVQTGKDLVLVCRQNSLLPGLLELLQAGVGDGNASKQKDNAPGGLARLASRRGQGGRI
jgi:hypothetical protein